jgi:hypothetical protein
MVRLLSLLILLLLPNPFTSRGPSRDVTRGQPDPVAGQSRRPVAHPPMPREPVPSVVMGARAAPPTGARDAALRESVPAKPDSTPAMNDPLRESAPEPPSV